MERPEVDSIDGLSPAISIEQKTTNRSPRSTVGTITEIYDYLRVLYSSIGVPHCPNCGIEISRQSTEQILQQILVLPEGERVMILAPIVRGRKGEYKKDLEKLSRQGFVRARVDGVLRSLDEEIPLDRRKNHTIEIVVDRLLLKAGLEKRLEASIETAAKLANGLVTVSVVNGEEKLYSQKLACPNCGTSVPQLEPRSFSFNSPFGACESCNGLGSTWSFDPAKVIVDASKPLLDGGLGPGASSSYMQQQITEGAAHLRIKINKPFEDLPKKSQTLLLEGGNGFDGILQILAETYEEAGPGYREWLMDYMSPSTCPECHGRRLRPSSLAVRVKGAGIAELTEMSGRPRARDRARLEAQRARAADRRARDRRDPQPAGVPDRRRPELPEPGAIGRYAVGRRSAAHSPGDADRLETARRAVRARRAVHRAASARQRPAARHADAPARSRQHGAGGRARRRDHRARRLRDRSRPRRRTSGRRTGGRGHSARDRSAIRLRSPANIFRARCASNRLPAAATGTATSWSFTARASTISRTSPSSFRWAASSSITGVSGSGKSTLINDILYRALSREIYGSHDEPGAHVSIEGLEHIDKVVEIDQSPIGRTPRSNPATYTGVFTPIRELYAMLPESRERGYKAGRFSFNVKGGRCEACQGDGLKRIEMNFLPDVYVTCDVCRGRRYNSETLQVKYKGQSIADLLESTVEDAVPILENIPQINIKLQTLHDVGLGYIHLGQSSTTLSGGEAQRIKLARELSKRQTGRTLYILDEPTTGLHFEDVRRLLDVLQRLVDLGNTVIVIEHQLDVIKSADWIIDMGPEGGEARRQRRGVRHARADPAIQEELHGAGARKSAANGQSRMSKYAHEPLELRGPQDRTD